MTAAWTSRVARMLAAELAGLDAERRACRERAAVRIDNGAGLSAIAAVAALPAGPRRDLEIAIWARRLAAGPPVIAVIAEDLASDDNALRAFLALERAVRDIDATAVRS